MTDQTHSTETAALNTLTATLIDSVTGFEDAAANIEDTNRLQQLFRERASERGKVVEELRAEVRRLGGDPEDDGSFLGKTHQRFLDLKAAITGRDDQAIVNEVERGEDYLKEKFEAALNSDTFSGETRAVIERAYQSVRSGHDQISALKHGMEGTTA
ncbi:MAG: PA2169 family four-helix-bundle protein [Sphingomicrobium sp.]